MLLAQALAEYGLFAAVAESMSDAFAAAEEIVLHPEPIHIGVAAAIVVVLWFVMGRR